MAYLGPDPAGGGGMAAVIRSLLGSSLAERYELTMIVTYRSPAALSRLRTFALSLVQLVRWCLRPGRRLVHIHSAVRGSLYRKSVCVFVARAMRRPVLFHLHAGMGDIEAFSERLGVVRRWLFGRALGAATMALAVSTESARTMERCFGVEGIGVVPNAAPPVSGEAVDVGSGDRPRVLYLGGFANPVKGGEVLLEALAPLAASWPDVAFSICGPGEPPPALADLIARRPNVEWGGWLDEEAKAAAFAATTIFVLPSLSEGLPVAMLEAMSWGRAIVATRVGGVPDVVEDGVEAKVVEPGDPRALETAIAALLDDPGLRTALGAAARRRAGTLNEDEVWGRLDAIYRELAA